MIKHYPCLEAAILLLAVCMLGKSAGLASGSPGYLPVVGPAPVRFQTPSPVVPVALWPPLIQPEKLVLTAEAQMTNAPAAEALGIEPPTNAIPSAVTTAGSPGAAPPSQATAVIPFPIPAPSQHGQVPDGLADLQAQLNYLLSVSTNEPGAKVIMPVFVPPAPPLPYPSSHASYESQ